MHSPFSNSNVALIALKVFSEALFGKHRVGIGASVAYDLIGFASQDKPFSGRKFVRTVVIQALATLGLTVTGVSGDVYTSAVGHTAVTVFVQKI
ncbi:hypothetical protein MUO79_03035 [Candidatus Bathyarchaeota archaeon]|nr:hypothetical protein [Candidatus Bathyarchaeota archaeon]